jgi:hypothetical protein
VRFPRWQSVRSVSLPHVVLKSSICESTPPLLNTSNTWCLIKYRHNFATLTFPSHSLVFRQLISSRHVLVLQFCNNLSCLYTFYKSCPSHFPLFVPPNDACWDNDYEIPNCIEDNVTQQQHAVARLEQVACCVITLCVCSDIETLIVSTEQLHRGAAPDTPSTWSVMDGFVNVWRTRCSVLFICIIQQGCEECLPCGLHGQATPLLPCNPNPGLFQPPLQPLSIVIWIIIVP